LISLQWYVLFLTLRLAVYTLLGKARSNLGTNFLHLKKYALPYTYGYRQIISSRLCVRLKQWFSTWEARPPWGSFAFFLGVARASDKYILYFLFGTTFCRRQNVTW